MLGLSAVILRVAWASQVAQVQNLPAKHTLALHLQGGAKKCNSLVCPEG